MREYKVQRGDVFSKIASKFGTSVCILKDLNPQIKNINLIPIGQIINLPDVNIPIGILNKEKDFDITVKQLCEIVPRLNLTKADQIMKPLNSAMKEFSINVPSRKTAFIAQIAHETGGFRWFRELGNDTYFKKYDGRKDLGNVNPGDGARFKGRGFIQITGRINYSKAAAVLNVDLINNPELAEDLVMAVRIAGWYWSSRGLNELADKDNFLEITRRINGGVNGLAQRKEYWMRAKKIIV